MAEKVEEKYILSESPEINVGESPRLRKFFSAFPALKYRNYQYYFFGQLISLTGTWLQIVAQGWLVFQLTHSAFWVGLVSALGSLPTLLFALFGGVIVDRFSKKKILIFTQTTAMILAFILGILTVFKIINVYEILTLAFLLGMVTALDMPARQAFFVEMVDKEDLPSAIALSAGTFNGARVIGPGLAGIAIISFGTGGAFLINALTYLAVIFALLLIKTKSILPKVHPNPIKAIKEGLSYSFSHQTIRLLLISTGVMSIFGWSYSTLLPVIVQDIFHQGADSLGYFYSVAGFGAIFGLIFVSSLSKKINNLVFIIGGTFLFTVSLIFFSFTTNLSLALVLLFLTGLGLIAQLSMTNTTIQQIVGDHIRGRVMSIYTLMFLGLTPIGSFQIGLFAQHFGSEFAIRLGAFIMLIFGVYLYFNKEKIQYR